MVETGWGGGGDRRRRKWARAEGRSRGRGRGSTKRGRGQGQQRWQQLAGAAMCATCFAAMAAVVEEAVVEVSLAAAWRQRGGGTAAAMAMVVVVQGYCCCSGWRRCQTLAATVSSSVGSALGVDMGGSGGTAVVPRACGGVAGRHGSAAREGCIGVSYVNLLTLCVPWWAIQTLTVAFTGCDEAVISLAERSCARCSSRSCAFSCFTNSLSCITCWSNACSCRVCLSRSTRELA